MKTTVFLLAFLGWIASAIVHIASTTAEDLFVQYPFIMGLHLGVILVWASMFIYLKRDDDYRQFRQAGFVHRLNLIALFKIFFKNTPPYLKLIAIIGFIYAQTNVIISMIDSGIEINSTRHFSGYWIAFYGIAMAVLYPFKKQVVL